MIASAQFRALLLVPSDENFCDFGWCVIEREREMMCVCVVLGYYMLTDQGWLVQ